MKAARLAFLLQSGSAVVVAEMIVVALLNLLSFAVLARVVDTNILGLWFLLSSVLTYARIADFWSNGLSSFVAEALGSGQREAALQFVGTSVVSGVVGHTVLAALTTIALWFVAPWLVDSTNVVAMRQALPLIAVAFWLTAVAGTFQTGFLGFGRPFLKACQTVGGAAIFLAMTPLLAPSQGLQGILIGQIVQGTAMLIFGTVAFGALVARTPRFLKWNGTQFRMLAKFGSKAILLGALQLSIEPIVKLLTNHFAGLTAVTAVELASRLISAVRALIVSFGQLVVPTLARLASTDIDRAKRLYAEVRSFYVLATIPAFSILLGTAPLAEILFLGKLGTGYAIYLGIISTGWIANTLAAPAHFLFLSQRRMRPLIVSHAIMGCGGAGMGYSLGLMFGVTGSLAGAALAIIIAAIYLDRVASKGGSGLFGIGPVLVSHPSLYGAIFAMTLLPAASSLSDVFAIGAWGYISASAFATLVVLVCCARPTQLRALISLPGSLG